MIAKNVGLYDHFPRFYRMSWYDAVHRRAVCYPIGLHWLMMLGRWLWELSHWLPRSRFEAALRGAYQEGLSVGRQQTKHQADTAPVADGARITFEPASFFVGDVQHIVVVVIQLRPGERVSLHELRVRAVEAAFRCSERVRQWHCSGA